MSSPDVPSNEQQVRELQEKIAALEKQTRSRFVIQVLVGPVLIAVLGYYFNLQVEKAKHDFQQLEVETKRVDSIRAIIPELFSEPAQRALIAEQLVSALVDTNLKEQIHKAVEASIRSRINVAVDNAQSNPKVSAAVLAAIDATSQELTTETAKNLVNYFKQNNFYVVVASELSREKAIESCQRFARLGYKAEVYATTNPYYAVVVGIGSFSAARQLRDTVVAKKQAIDSFVAPEKYIRLPRVYP
jgi:hypothetical protein